MIKRLSLLALCAFAVSGQTHATHGMNTDTDELSLFFKAAMMHTYSPSPFELHEACRKRDLAKVTTLLDAGVFLNAPDIDGATPLHIALSKGYTDIAELLIKHGAPLGAQDDKGRTPLHIALFYGHEGYKEIAELLIKHGAPINAQDCWKRTPLHIALSEGYTDIAELIVCASFFVPRPSQAQASLQELCYSVLNKFDEDTINKHIVPCMAERIPLNPSNNILQLITDNAPLNVQQALVTYWQQQAVQASDERVRAISKSKQQALLNTHYNRHLQKIQEVLEIGNKQDEIIRDLAFALQLKINSPCEAALRKNYHNIVTLLNIFHRVTTFDQLPEKYQKTIMATIGSYLHQQRVKQLDATKYYCTLKCIMKESRVKPAPPAVEVR